MPRGKIRPEVWAKQQAHGRKVLPAPIAEVVNGITEPFVTALSDYVSSQASFYNGQILLTGDALALFRPHLAQSTNQAAFNCLLLEKVLMGKMALAEWDTQVLQYARVTRLRSNTIGSWYLSGYGTYLLDELWYRWELLMQRWNKLW